MFPSAINRLGPMLDSEGRLSVEVGAPAPAGLCYVCDSGPAIRRRRAGKGFVYLDAKGKRIADLGALKRIRALAIPPAWTDVWICPSPRGHIQAVGRDARGRKQYRYHADYREAREEAKFEHMHQFAKALPAIRTKVAEHMSLRGLTREKVLATVVHLLETTLIRVGNDEYARANQSYGLTTLKTDHVAVEGTEVRFEFTGKSGKQWSLTMRDRRVARILRACQELPGQELLQYYDAERELRAVSSDDVNAYLREAAGYDVTAKDFRTWAGSVLMVRFLKEAGAYATLKEGKRTLRAAIARVAQALGNTPAVCRKSYIHPAIVSGYLEGKFMADEAPGTLEASKDHSQGLRHEEASLLALLNSITSQLAGLL
jgi:DNA topoisomerase I